MIDIGFNRKKIIPDAREYGKILISTMLVVYFFKSLLFRLVPFLGGLSTPWDLVVVVFLIFYFKNLFDVKFEGRDYF